MYDMAFAKINQSLYATTFLAYGGKVKLCATCMASSHVPTSVPRQRSGRNESRQRGGACFLWNDSVGQSRDCWFEHVS